MGLSLDRLIQIRRELHQIPEIGLAEFKTQAYLLKVINELPQAKLEIETWQTSIIVLVKGSEGKRTIGWRTDMDGLPILEETGLPFKSHHKGQMHACGHDFHMTIALGVLAAINEAELLDDYCFIFQPAEENEAGGKLLYDAGRISPYELTELYALHIQPALAVGKISTKIGTLCAGDCEFRVTFTGKGGHCAYPHLANDMIVAGTQFIQQLQTIVSRNINPLEGAVITVASFHGGEATNVIPEKVKIAGSIRSLSQEINQLTQQRLEEIAKGIAQSFQCDVSLTLDQKGYLPVNNDQQTTQKLQDFAKGYQGIHLEKAETVMVAEDFGYLLNEIPGTMFWLGVETEFELHHKQLNPKEEAIPLAIAFVSDYFKQL